MSHLAKRSGKLRGENGALAQATTGIPLLDLFYQLVRTMPEEGVTAGVATVLEAAHSGSDAISVADLFVLAFQTRDCRGGKGEKKLFYRLLLELFMAFPETVLTLLDHVSEFGYCKDLIEFASVCEEEQVENASRVSDKVCDIFVRHLRSDKELLDASIGAAVAVLGDVKPPVRLSFFAKYAPREGQKFASFQKKLAKALFSNAHDSNAKYRKLLAELTKALEVPEVYMCSNRFDEINFSRVPALCLTKNRKAFLNEVLRSDALRRPDDAKRMFCRANLLQAVANDKVTGEVLLPTDLITNAFESTSEAESAVFDAQWDKMKNGIVKQMEQFVSGAKTYEPGSVNLGKLVALVDVSGSMNMSYSGSMKSEPMEAAIGLGILVSELSSPAFNGGFITFENEPKWVTLRGKVSLKSKVEATMAYRDMCGENTDFEAAIRLILDIAIKCNLTADEVPDIIVFSDMQFDEAGVYDQTMHDQLTAQFADAGMKICGTPYPVPKIIYWNLRGDTEGVPVTGDTPNVQLLSGYSPSLLKLLLAGKPMDEVVEEVVEADGSTTRKVRSVTPWDTLRRCLDDERYFPIREVLSASNEGLLSSYSFTRPVFAASSSSTSSGGGGGGRGGEENP